MAEMEAATVAPSSPWMRPEAAAVFMGITVRELMAIPDLPQFRPTPRVVRFNIDVLKSYRHVQPRGASAETLTKLMRACLARHPATGRVYFLKCREIVKVGYSSDPDRRRAELQAVIPFKLEALGSTAGSVPSERAIHGLLDASKSDIQTEWFYHNTAMLEAIAEVCNG